MLTRKANSRGRKRVLVHGLTYFGQVFADFMSGDGWEFRYYPDTGLRNITAMFRELGRCDLVYQIGGRITIGKFLRAVRFFRKDRIVMHWVGSDTLEAQLIASAEKREPQILNSIHHWADSPWILEEVRQLGLRCEHVPLPSSRIAHSPSPLPRDFCVLVYVPSLRSAELYGLDAILGAATQLPQVQFELVGLRDGQLTAAPANLRCHKRIPDLTEYYRRATVVWRPTRHDGLSWMVCEALGYGRHVLWSYQFPGCIQVRSADEAVAQIQRLYDLHRDRSLCLNCEGAKFISCGDYFPANFKKNILCHLDKILVSA